MDRREALKRLGAAAAALGAPRPRARVLSPVGLQLYTLRAEMRRDLEGTLARVAEIGYQEVEFAGYFERTPRQIAEALRAAGLRAPSAHFGLEALEGEAGARNLALAREVGHRYVIVAWIAPAQRGTLDGWRRVADRFNAVGRAARGAGLQFAYHNHDFEFRPLEGRVPFDVLCEATDPELVRIELDLFWITHGGGDPLAFFRRWPGRVHLVHVKDRTADGRMVDVGAGVIDWRAILGRRREAGIRHYFVEHDEPADPFASVTASYRYLSQLDV